ncbi:SH3 domain-containing protein [Jiella sp. MQZ9-1]|uniref:SH3 domain-containing protein n=1 Tax=Jiella flava TaxID=2816857 RepID=A0A939JW77_9HYPH|nr:SH3 domain-containing protein [Jiella flava]MBO0663229.1 SH3 domain-containing protein [Jiella flava]MCD2471805.1 SH3 domain-containing protein [Jiella flava]
MKLPILAAAALTATVAIPAGQAFASQKAIATTNVNLRAGPSTSYPAVDMVEAGEGLRVFGCLQTRSWCDVRYRGQRGWMSANYIAVASQSYRARREFDPYSAPVITFSVDSYWGDHYRQRSWYRDRDRFRGDFREDRGPRDRDFDRRDRERHDWERARLERERDREQADRVDDRIDRLERDVRRERRERIREETRPEPQVTTPVPLYRVD